MPDTGVTVREYPNLDQYNSASLCLPRLHPPRDHGLPHTNREATTMERHLHARPAPLPPAPRAPLFLRLYARVVEWQRNARTRSHLAQLNAQQLADIGLSESDRRVELDKPFWR